MARQKKPVDEVARDHFSEIVRLEKERGISQREMAERISRHLPVPIPQQYVSAYTKGREIPRDVAEAIEDEFGYRAAWLYGYDNVMTTFEDSAIRMSERRDARDMRETWFELTARLAGWDIEHMASRDNVAAPFTGAGDDYDDTLTWQMQFSDHATLSKGDKHVTLNELQFDAFIDKQLASFDLDCTYLPRFMTKEV